jgi:hypothetical protein
LEIKLVQNLDLTRPQWHLWADHSLAGMGLKSVLIAQRAASTILDAHLRRILTPGIINRWMTLDVCAWVSSNQNSSRQRLGTLASFLTTPGCNWATERERAKVEMTTTSTCTSGVTREPFHWRAHSPEHESAATEWPCDGALSRSWSNHVLVSTTSSRKWWWPLGIHGNGGPIHGMHALRRFTGDHDAWHVLSRIRKQLPRARSTDELQ